MWSLGIVALELLSSVFLTPRLSSKELKEIKDGRLKTLKRLEKMDLSKEAHDFVGKLLELDAGKRLSAQ